MNITGIQTKPDDNIVVTLKGNEYSHPGAAKTPLIFTIAATCFGALLTLLGIIMVCSYYTIVKNNNQENVTLEVPVSNI